MRPSDKIVSPKYIVSSSAISPRVLSPICLPANPNFSRLFMRIKLARLILPPFPETFFIKEIEFGTVPRNLVTVPSTKPVAIEAPTIWFPDNSLDATTLFKSKL